MQSLIEKWYKYEGRVYVKRYWDKGNGVQEYMGEELTPFREIPFIQINFSEQATCQD